MYDRSNQRKQLLLKLNPTNTSKKPESYPSRSNSSLYLMWRASVWRILMLFFMSPIETIWYSTQIQTDVKMNGVCMHSFGCNMCVCVCENVCVCECVYVCQREREREGVPVSMHTYVCAYLCENQVLAWNKESGKIFVNSSMNKATN